MMWSLQDNRGSSALRAFDVTFHCPRELQQRTFLECFRLAPECLLYLGGSFCYQ